MKTKWKGMKMRNKRNENETMERWKWKIVSNEDKETTNKKIKNNKNKATHSPHFQRESANLEEEKNLGATEI
jgi:hypothetical protein